MAVEVTPKETVWIFAGCGGTLYHGLSGYTALAREHQPTRVFFVDPDRVAANNWDRQWFEGQVGDYKSDLAVDAFGWDSSSITGKFPAGATPEDWTRGPIGRTCAGRDVVVICNVDSHKARCEIREWCKAFEGRATMIVSGCDHLYGQVWIGHWENGDAVHDWLILHPEVAVSEGPKSGMYGQNAISNCVTGMLSVYCLHLVCQDGVLALTYEGYWNTMAKKLKVWQDQVVAAIRWPEEEVARASE